MNRGVIAIALVVRFVALVGIVATAVPLVQASPKPVPWTEIGAFIAATITYLGTYAIDYFAWISGRNGHPHDVALFKEFVSLLAPDYVRTVFTEFDFGGTFHYEDIRALNRFADTWNLPDKEFRDKSLEAARKDAHAKAQVVAREIAVRTRPFGVGMQTVKLANVDPQPERVYEDARTINNAATAFSAAYVSMLRLGRARLT
jgi:hypothetical protein